MISFSILKTLKLKIIFLVCLALLVETDALAIEYPVPGMPAGAAKDPGAYIAYLFTFGLGLAGFLAVGALVIGGILYMTGGTVSKVDKAKTVIVGALSGLVLLLCSYLLLYTIDPSLVNLSPIGLKSTYKIPLQKGSTIGADRCLWECLPHNYLSYDSAKDKCVCSKDTLVPKDTPDQKDCVKKCAPNEPLYNPNTKTCNCYKYCWCVPSGTCFSEASECPTGPMAQRCDMTLVNLTAPCR